MGLTFCLSVRGRFNEKIINIKDKNILYKLIQTDDKKIFCVNHPGYYTEWNYNGIYKMYKNIVTENINLA
jgi:hypothetical protein